MGTRAVQIVVAGLGLVGASLVGAPGASALDQDGMQRIQERLTRYSQTSQTAIGAAMGTSTHSTTVETKDVSAQQEKARTVADRAQDRARKVQDRQRGKKFGSHDGASRTQKGHLVGGY